MIRFISDKLSWKVKLSGLLIFILFSLPGGPVERVRKTNLLLEIFLSDAACHLVCYGGLAFIVWWDYSRQKPYPLSLGKIFLYCFLYSLFIEIYQIPLPWRSFEAKDLLVNSAGILLSLLTTRLI